mmetsp:Transcript_8885/g.21939  ORF Transcript_8885/g.21939 Transcript_8885/m.21939 type:complete len:994 (-) Transcript_8885:126-3107(-)
MSSLDENSNPVLEETGESSVPGPSYSNDNIRVVHTISTSSSFEEDVNSSHNNNNNNNNNSDHASEEGTETELMPNSTKSEHVVRVSPTSLQINRSFSESNLAGKPRRTNSVESFASGELIISDGNDIQNRQQQQQQQQQSQKSFESSPGSSFEDVVKTDTDSSEEDEEDDSEVLLAKEMALAIAKNPSMTPAQLRELQTQVMEKVEEKSKEKALVKAEKKKRKKSKKLRISEEMKAAYKGTKLNAKKAYEQIERNSKAGASHIRKEAKKGLRAAGLMKQSSQDSTTEPSLMEALEAPNTDSDSQRAAPDVDDDKIRLNATIWKRRSGLGKYSMTAPWERRRVVLMGSRLIYYKTQQEASDGEDEEDRSTSEHDTPGLMYGGPSEDPSNWMNTIMDKAGVSMPWESGSSTFKGARGYLDLRKEKASASASYGHTGAPTPFAMSIKVASTGATKYKFCFDTQQELMLWLSAITDVVVAGSVDAYNAEILDANDPSAHGMESAIAQSTGIHWSEPSPRNAAASHEEGRGHQLWSTECYSVASDNLYKSKSSAQISVTSIRQDSDMDIVGANPKDYMVDKSTGENYLAIPSKYMEPAIYLVNAVILAARAESTLSDELFWYLLVFFNLLGVFMVRTVQVGGSVKLKPELQGKFGQKIPKDKFDSGLQTIHSTDSTDTGVPSLVDENFVPPAGSTSIKIENPKDLPTKDGVIFPGWREIDASQLMVRGCGYKTNKTKVPCPNSLYQCVELDVFESRARVPDMAGRVILPTVNFDDGDKPKTWSAPDQFVVTVALPTDQPKLYGGSTNNGGGYTLTMYCVMRQETRDILRRVTAEDYNPAKDEITGDPNKSMVNSVKLFDEWCRRAPSDDSWMSRFKVVPQGDNLAEIGLPAWIANYNGKPFLIKRPGTTGFLYRHPDKSCMEFDVSLHPFPYLAKQGICYMKDGFFKKILATLAFCIEGRADDELPECLIGLFQICYPNPIHATQAEDFFSGKSSRSK